MRITACSPAPGGPSSISIALARLGRGEGFDFDDLFALVYRRLRRIALGLHCGRAQGHTLQATALVHEAYMKLMQTPGDRWQGRRHFFATAARSMRQILIDHARYARCLRHGGGVRREDLDLQIHGTEGGPTYDLLALDEVLERLSAEHSRVAQVVELRFYAGFSNEETGKAIGKSTRTVERDWRFAQAWLARELGEA